MSVKQRNILHIVAQFCLFLGLFGQVLISGRSLELLGVNGRISLGLLSVAFTYYIYARYRCSKLGLEPKVQWFLSPTQKAKLGPGVEPMDVVGDEFTRLASQRASTKTLALTVGYIITLVGQGYYGSLTTDRPNIVNNANTSLVLLTVFIYSALTFYMMLYRMSTRT